jgi:CBS domain-containing protein
MKYVSDILIERPCSVKFIDGESSVTKAMQFLGEEKIDAVMVVTEGEVHGLFSERDYTSKVAAKGQSGESIMVKDVVSKALVTVYPDQSCEDCLKLMNENQIRHLPVVDRSNEKIVGLLGVLDVVNSILLEKEKEISIIEEYVSETWPF